MKDAKVLVADGVSFPISDYLDDIGTHQGLLKDVREAGGHAWCACQDRPRPLVVRRIRGRYFLALWPGDGDKHKVSCSFHRDPELASSAPDAQTGAPLPAAPGWTRSTQERETLNPSAAPATPPSATENATGFDTLQASFSWIDGQRSTAAAAGEQGVSLQGLFQVLWERSRLNAWWPWWKRSWWRVKREVSLAADDLMVSGEHLGERLLVPGGRGKQDDGVDELQSFDALLSQRTAAGGQSLGLIMAEVERLSAAKQGYVMRLRGLSRPVFLTASARAAMLRRFPRALSMLEGRTPPRGRLLGLFLVGRSQFGDGLNLRGAYLTLTNDVWLPCSSPAELDLVDALMASERGFVKAFSPVPAFDQAANAGSDLLVLRDCTPPFAIWACAMSGPAAMRREAELREHATRLGFAFGIWHDAASEADWPASSLKADTAAL